MNVQCLKGHKSVRRLAEHQVHDIAEDLFKRMFVCLDCGFKMVQLGTEVDGDTAESIFLCPNHGLQKREFPSRFLPTVSLLSGSVESTQSVIDSFRCETCGLVYAISDIDHKPGFLEMTVQCANGHKTRLYIADEEDESLMTTVLQRLAHCDRCGMPGHITDVERKKKTAKIFVTCPVHGVDRKEVPIEILPAVEQAVSEIPEDAVVKGMLISQDCHQLLTIRSVEAGKDGYRFRCVCPGKGRTTTRIIPVHWSDSVTELITNSILSCDECGLLTSIQDVKPRKKKVEFKIVCPIHGVMPRSLHPDVFARFIEKEKEVDRIPSIVKSLSCERCSMPLIVRDVEHKRGVVEFDVACRNGHRLKRFFTPDMDSRTLVNLYKNLYQCPECYDQLDLVDIEPRGRESRVVLLCSIHGKHVLDIPPEHAEAMRVAYEELEADKARPPVEAPKPVVQPIIEARPEQIRPKESDVEVMRGCEIIGGKFDYKVKILNESGYVITNVTVSIVAYPQDCMELAGETVKTISRIEIGGFRSPTFIFYPTKDCVQGKVVATVSYIDFRDQLHTMEVEPYIIRSVCDLLQPIETTSKQFELILGNLTCTEQEQVLDWNAQVLFTKAEKILPMKNFHVVDTEERIVGGQFIGTIRGYAAGKYTGKKVAVIFIITGPVEGRHATVNVKALGEDIAMLPTTIDELAETIDSWICLRCGAPLQPEQVEELGKRTPIRCKYCAHTLTIALYLQ